MTYESKFYDIRLAIGDLVMSGISVSVEPYNHTVAIWDRNINEIVCVAFRDGTTYKIKKEKIENWIENHSQ